MKISFIKNSLDISEFIYKFFYKNIGWYIIKLKVKKDDELLEIIRDLKKENRGLHRDLNKQIALADEIQRLFDNHAAVMLIIDSASGEIVQANDAAVDFYGWSRKVMTQMTIHQINILPHDEIQKVMKKAGESNQIHFEFRHRLADGSVRDVEVFSRKIEIQGRKLLNSIIHDITDRKRTEQKLVKSIDLLRTVMNSIDALIYVADMETHELLFVNEYGLKYWGKDILGQQCWKALQGMDGPCSFCSNDKLLDEKGRPAGLYRWEFQNKINSRWYDKHECAVPWIDDRLVRIEIATDITECKQAEDDLRNLNETLELKVALRTRELDLLIEALYESEKKYRTVADYNYDWEYWIDQNGKLIYNSPSFERITGYPPVEFMDNPNFVNSIVHPDDRLMLESNMDKIIQNRDFLSFDFRILDRNGDVVWLSHRSLPVYDKSGRWLGRRVSNQNITEKVNLWEKLQASEMRFKHLVESVTDYIYTVSMINGEVVQSSHGPGCIGVTGFDTEEYKADSTLWDRMIYDEDKPMVLSNISKMIDVKISVSFEHRIIHKDGSIRWVRNTIVPYYNEQDNSLSYDGLVKDITEHKDREREINRLNKYIIDLQENERQKIAADLHDSVSQTIAAARLNFESYKYNFEDFKSRYEIGMKFLDNASNELREIYTGLYPSILKDIGLESAIKWYARNQLQHNGIEVELKHSLDISLKDEITINIYRIIQEIFSNINRHSCATRVGIQIFNDQTDLYLNIVDNGKGFSSGSNREKMRGNGLVNIEQRVSSLKGSFEIISSRTGIRVLIKVPIGENNERDIALSGR